MLGISWNGSLSRLTVGASSILLMLALPNSWFWLNLTIGTFEGAFQMGEGVSFALFFCFSYVFGAILAEIPTSSLNWEPTTAAALSTENNALILIVTDNKSRSELFLGIGRSFSLFGILSVYYLFSHILFGLIGDKLQLDWQKIVLLLLATVFAFVFSRVIKAYAKYPFDSSKQLVNLFNEEIKARKCS